MRPRNLLITLGLFGLLLVYWFFTQTGGRGFNTLQLPKLTTLGAGDIQKIELVQTAGQLVLEKKGSEWQLILPVVFPADRSKVETAQKIISELKFTDLIAEAGKDQADYGLNSLNALHLIAWGPAGKRTELSVGNRNRASTHTFVQRPGDSRVYQVLGDITDALRRPALEWRSQQIFDLSPDAVRQVDLQYRNGKRLSLFKSEEVPQQIVKDNPKGVTPTALPGKVIWKAEGRAQPLADDKVNPYLNGFTRLVAARITDLTEWKGQPLAVLTLKTAEGESALEVLEFNKKQKKYLVRRPGQPVIYELEEYQGKNFLKELKDLV